MGQYDKVYMAGDYGEPVTRRQRQALVAVQKAVRKEHPKNHGDFEFIVPQGSWQPHTTYSGWTHTRRGVADLFFEGMTDMDWFKEVLRITRRVGGQAAMGRGPWCKMPYHLHVLDLDVTGMHPDAQWQVREYRAGNDALVAGRNDPFPYRPRPLREWEYQGRKHKN